LREEKANKKERKRRRLEDEKELLREVTVKIELERIDT